MMSNLTPKQRARLRALREITELIGNLNSSLWLQFPFEGSPYLTSKEKKAIRREIDDINWQLHKRKIKLEDKLYGR